MTSDRLLSDFILIRAIDFGANCLLLPKSLVFFFFDIIGTDYYTWIASFLNFGLSEDYAIKVSNLNLLLSPEDYKFVTYMG